MYYKAKYSNDSYSITILPPKSRLVYLNSQIVHLKNVSMVGEA